MRPKCAFWHSDRVITHLSYHEEEYQSATQCLAAIREFVGRGWEVSWVSGPHGGTYLVRYRLDHGPGAFAVIETLASYRRLISVGSLGA